MKYLGKDIDVTKRPGKLMGKWAEIIAAAPLGDPAKQRFIAKMEKSRGKIFDAYFKFRDQYECEFPDTWVEEEEDDPDRYDRDDPCKGKILNLYFMCAFDLFMTINDIFYSSCWSNCQRNGEMVKNFQPKLFQSRARISIPRSND